MRESGLDEFSVGRPSGQSCDQRLDRGSGGKQSSQRSSEQAVLGEKTDGEVKRTGSRGGREECVRFIVNILCKNHL